MPRHGAQRIASIVAVGLAASLSVPVVGTAAAAKPLQRIHEVVTDVSCVFDTAEGHRVILTASSNNRFGSYAEVLVEAPTFETLLVGFTEGDPWSGPSFDMTLPLVLPETGEPAGEAHVAGTYTPTSEPDVQPVRHRDGNSWATGTTSHVDLAVDVTAIHVPGHTVLAESARCDGSTTVLDLKMTDPAAVVWRSQELSTDVCQLEGLDDVAIRLTGDLRELRYVLAGVEGGRANGTVALRAGAGTATADVVDDEGNTLTEATIAVTVREAGPLERETYREHRLSYRATYQPYLIDVHVTTAGGGHGTATCDAWFVSERMMSSQPDGDGH